MKMSPTEKRALVIKLRFGSYLYRHTFADCVMSVKLRTVTSHHFILVIGTDLRAIQFSFNVSYVRVGIRSSAEHPT